MNILIVNSNTLPMPPVKGGAVETLIDIYLRGNDMNNDPHNITLYSVYDEKAKKESNFYKNTQIKYINTQSPIYKINKVIRFGLKKIKGKYVANVYLNKIYNDLKGKIEKFDLVIVENVAEYGLVLKKLNPKKMVLHLHNDILNIQTKQANEIYECYDEFWCLSKFILNRVSQIKKSEKIKLLYNGIETQRFDLTSDNKKVNDLRAKYRIKQNDIVLMYSGRLVPEKGVLELLKAFSKIKESNVKLLIVGSSIYGDTKSTPYIRELSKVSDKKKSSVIYTGYINYSDMPYVYQLADVGIVPSLWEEPFALTVVEFLASGKPIIATNSGAIPELVNDDFSILVDKNNNMVENLYDAINSVIKGKNFLPSSDIKKYSKNFDSNIYYNRFEQLVLNK